MTTSTPATTSTRYCNRGEYLDRSRLASQHNANQGTQLGGLILNSSGRSSPATGLSTSPPRDRRRTAGRYHIHRPRHVCRILRRLVPRRLHPGLQRSGRRSASAPPRPLPRPGARSSNFLGALQNGKWAGAPRRSHSFDTTLAPFVRLDNMGTTRSFSACRNLSATWCPRWGSRYLHGT